jgi:hypothetical protein
MCMIFFFYPYLTKWGWYNMFSSCCDKDSGIVFKTGRLTSILLKTGLGTTANAAGINGLTCLRKHRRARDNLLVTYPMAGLCDRCLASAIARQPLWPRVHQAPSWDIQINNDRNVPTWHLHTYIHTTHALSPKG